MAYSTIDKPNQYFNTVLYTGNGTTQSLTGVNFQPDWVWVKERSGANSHMLADSVRGATKILFSNLTNAEDTDANSITSFDSDGFGVGSSGNVNASGDTYVGWNWKANGTAVSNTDGSITSSVSANTDSGFSIVSYTGNGTGSATFGHGLGATPKIVIIKRTDVSDGWQFWFNNTIRLGLNVTNADYGNNPISTSSTLVTTPSGVDTAWNTNGGSYISYCFADVKGFSKMGSYVGNGSTDGTFVYTGFKPAFVMFKSSSNVTEWIMHDNDRLGYNGGNQPLFPNNNDSENVNSRIDLLSNGFKLKDSSVHWNGSGYSFIYMAFAENPLVAGNYVPTTAR